MKKLLLSISLILLSSCSNDSSDDNSNSGPILLRKSITTNSQGTQTTDYVYDGNKIVRATTNNGVVTKFYYTGELITKWEIYNNSVLVHTRLLSYNSQNNLSSTIELNHSNNQGHKSTLTYNSNGTITHNMYSGDLISQTFLYGTFTATLLNNEITSLKDEINNIIYTPTYDSKNNFMINVLGWSKTRMALGSGTYRNVRGIFQNLTMLKITPPTGSQYTNETIQLTYNTDNFPVSGTSRVYSSSGALLSSESSLLYYE